MTSCPPGYQGYPPPTPAGPYSGLPPPTQNAFDHPPPPAFNHNAGMSNSYHPSVGFTRLPSSFHIWNVFESHTSCLELGPQLRGPVAYSAKMFSGSRLKVKEGPWAGDQCEVCTIEARHPFSQRSSISFDGFQSKIKETSQWHDGVVWPFDVDVCGQLQKWEWTKEKTERTSTLKKLIGADSKNLGNWLLVPSGGQGQPAGTFRAEGGHTFDQNAALGYFQFHGPAASGGMGDVFVNVAIAVLLRIISQHYVSSLAGLASV